MKLSIVIPAYNEEQNIQPTIKEILLITEKIAGKDEIRIIVVDDHSSDNTYDVVNKMNDARIKCIRLSKRSGSNNAIRAGIMESAGDAVLFVSADGQDDPSCLENMLEKWSNGATVVWALRKNRENEPWYYKIPAQLFYKIINWLSADSYNTINLSRADFCLLDRIVVDAINRCSERNTSLFGLILWLGFNQDFVEYDRRARRHGKSKWNFKSRLQIAKDYIVAFSGLPLRIASSLGILTALLGIIYAFIVVVNRLLFNIDIEGWTTLVVLILVIGGVQLTILGIIGEYLWRNLDESRKRPLYFIERKTTNKAE